MRFLKNNLPVKCDKLLSFFGGKVTWFKFYEKCLHTGLLTSVFSQILSFFIHAMLELSITDSCMEDNSLWFAVICVLERIFDNYHPTSHSPFRYPASPRSRWKLITNIALNEPGVTCTLKEIPLKDVNCTPPPTLPTNICRLTSLSHIKCS